MDHTSRQKSIELIGFKNEESQYNLESPVDLVSQKQIIPRIPKKADETMYQYFQANMNQHLKNYLVDDQYHQVDQLSNFIRVLEKSPQPWSKQQWIHLMENYSAQEVGQSQVSYQIRMNVPHKLRPKIWSWMIDVKKFDEILTFNTFIKARDELCPFEKIILIDVQRTFLQEPYFRSRQNEPEKVEEDNSQDKKIEDPLDILSRGQRQLFLLLRAFSNLDKQIGYTQGMNYLAAGILLQLIPRRKEKQNFKKFGDINYTTVDQLYRALQILMYVCTKYNWREVYSRKMKKIISLVTFFEKELSNHLPDIAQKIKQSNLPFHIFFDSYFFTVMNYKSPKEFSTRILDIFVAEGDGIIFQTLLRLLLLNREKICSLHDPEEVLNFIKSDLVSSTLAQFDIKQIIPLNYLEVMIKQ